jgi:hypothetical protein
LDTLNGSLYATSISNGLWKYTGSQLTAVSGKAYYDLNNNGQMDMLEPPFPNASIKLINQNTTTQTNLNGDYSFFSMSMADSILCTVNNTLADPVPSVQNFTGNNNQLNFALQFDSTDYEASILTLQKERMDKIKKCELKTEGINRELFGAMSVLSLFLELKIKFVHVFYSRTSFCWTLPE